MGDTQKIRIKKPTQTGSLLWMLILMPFLFALLNEVLGLPWAIRYVLDAVWCLLLVYLFLSGRWGDRGLGIWVCLFLIYTLLAYLPQWQSPLYYLWGVRNSFRFYAAFFAFAAFLKESDAQAVWKLFDKLFWLDIGVSLFQFFVLHLNGDHLGGLFSTETGGNGYTNLFFLIVVTKSIVFYLEKQEKPGICLAKCASALVVAAMAELKFFFLEFVLVVALAVLFTGFSWRKLMLVLASILGVAAGTAMLAFLFRGNDGWFTLKWMYDLASNDRGYTSSGDLNRLNAIAQINGLWLKNGWQRAFGLGLGNCDTSSFWLVNTPFYESYGHKHYTWISYAMMYLETGWIGLVFSWGFYVLTYVRILGIEKRRDGLSGAYCRIARIMAVLCVGISVYNSSLRTEAGYMVYLVLAMPFAMKNRQLRTIHTEAAKRSGL